MHKTALVGTIGRGDKLSSSAVGVVGVVGADVAYSQHTHTDMCWRPCTVRLAFLLRNFLTESHRAQRIVDPSCS